MQIPWIINSGPLSNVEVDKKTNSYCQTTGNYHHLYNNYFRLEYQGMQFYLNFLFENRRGYPFIGEWTTIVSYNKNQ